MGEYRIFGVEMSPYSVKVRAFARYKKIPHRWVVRSMDQMPEFNRFAKLPLVPCVACPDGSGMQDSTPIMEKLEAQFPEPPVRIADPALDFVAALLEEFADEWCNKPMFHYRWYYDADAKSAALRIAQETVPAGSPASAAEQMATMIESRMIGRLPFVGSGRGNSVNAEFIEQSFRRIAANIEQMLVDRPYLFGGRPTMADFGLYGQFKELLSDPTPGEWLRRRHPKLCAWVARMEDPVAEGELLPFAVLRGDILRLLADDVARCFLPWSDANARAIAAGQANFTVDLDGLAFSQETQKYHAKSLAEIRRKYAQAGDNPALRALMVETGCQRWLEG